MFDVEKILRSVSMAELIQKAGGSIDKNGRGACVLHGGKDTNAFHVYKKDGKEYWKCFSGPCGAGDVLSFVMAWQWCDFKQACAFLGADIISDPVAMEESARRRHEHAAKEAEEARLKKEARLTELQMAEMHLHYHNNMPDWGRLAWLARGLDESWQGFWNLGSCDDKKIMFKGEEYHTPTLTIPLVDREYKLLNIKHRLVNPPKDNDKYRPERDGLGAFPPFFAWPELEYTTPTIFIIEGEIKAMVAATITPTAEWQFVGVPGQDGFAKIDPEQLKGHEIVVVPDPGSELKAWNFAKSIHAKWLHLPQKIDDMIISSELDQNWLFSMKKQCRMAR
jgi:hypothetical protein